MGNNKRHHIPRQVGYGVAFFDVAAANLWTTRASQGKKTLTNPYDRSLIALS